MKKLLLSIFLMLATITSLSAYDASQIDCVMDQVTVSGSAFDSSIPFTCVQYENEYFVVIGYVSKNGSATNWSVILFVEDEDGNGWVAPYSYIANGYITSYKMCIVATYNP